MSSRSCVHLDFSSFIILRRILHCCCGPLYTSFVLHFIRISTQQNSQRFTFASKVLSFRSHHAFTLQYESITPSTLNLTSFDQILLDTSVCYASQHCSPHSFVSPFRYLIKYVWPELTRAVLVRQLS